MCVCVCVCVCVRTRDRVVLQGKGYNDVHVSTIDIPNEPKDAIGAEQGTLQRQRMREVPHPSLKIAATSRCLGLCVLSIYIHIYIHPTTPALGLTRKFNREDH